MKTYDVNTIDCLILEAQDEKEKATVDVVKKYYNNRLESLYKIRARVSEVGQPIPEMYLKEIERIENITAPVIIGKVITV
jgi:hypothetical protein